MLPINSNLNKENCVPVSSNCVIWQGPDLSCINLCNGDSVSEVIYKLATEICDLKDQLNLTDLDLKCLVDNCITCPDPEKILGVVLQLLIDKVCDLQTIIDTLGIGGSTEVEVRLAACFIPDFTDSNGDVTNPVPVSIYVQKIAQKICTILGRLDGIDLQITSIDNSLVDIDIRLDALEAAGQLQVVPICSSSPVLKDIDVAFIGLESAFCSLRTATGLPGDILNAITDNECEPVAPATVIKSLVDPSVILWTGSSSNVAQTLEKIWLAICDLRAAVSFIQDTCCQVNCDDLVVDFDVILRYNSQDDTYSLVFFFGEKTSLPITFTDCNAIGTKFNIVDALGHSNTIYLKIREDILNDADALTNGYIVDLPANIDPTSTIYLDSNACFTNGTITCVKCINKTILYTAPVCDYCEITNDGAVANTIVYQVCTTPSTTTTTASPTTTTTTAAVTTTTAAPTTTTTTSGV